MAAETTLHTTNPKMGYLLDEARSDLGKLSASISGWRQRSGGEGGGTPRSPRGSPRASTPHATLSDAVAERDTFQVVETPSTEKDVIAVGETERLILDDADKLSWLLDEARADLERTASTVTAEVVRTASTVSRKLTETNASLLARAGSSRGVGRGAIMSHAAARACACEAGGGGDEGKLSWLVAEAKADVTRAASTLSQRIASSKALAASISSRSVQASGSGDRGMGDGDADSKMAWLLEEARADFVRTTSRLSQRLAHENPASLDAASVAGSVSTTGSKKRGRTPSVVDQQQQQRQSQVQGIDLAQEAREDLKKFVNFLTLNEYQGSRAAGLRASAAPKESDLPKIIEIRSQEEAIDDLTEVQQETTLTFKREKSKNKEPSETKKQPEETIKSAEETPKTVEESPMMVDEPVKAVEEPPKAVEEPPQAVEEPPKPVEEPPVTVEGPTKTAEEKAEAAVMKAYIDDLVSPVASSDARDRYTADVAMPDVQQEELASTNKKAKKNSEEVPSFVDEESPPQDMVEDDDFVPITERDTYSDKGNDDSDEWDTMSDDFGATDAAGNKVRYRPQASMDDVNKKVENLLNTLRSEQVAKSKKTPQELADELIRKAQANAARKNAF